MSDSVQYPAPGCIVEYMEGNAPQIALITEEAGGRLRLLLPNRRETRLTAARLKAPTEFAMRNVSDVPDFEASTLRLVPTAFHISIEEDANPENRRQGKWLNTCCLWWNTTMCKAANRAYRIKQN